MTRLLRVLTCQHPRWEVPTLDTGCDDDEVEGKCPDCSGRMRMTIEKWKQQPGVFVREETT